MKLTPLIIRHAVCAGCGRKKFVFAGKSDFCSDCLDEHLDLVVRANNLPNREIIPGALADMHDCLAPGGNDASGYSAAFREAISRRECVDASIKRHDRASSEADYQANDVALTIYNETFTTHRSNGITSEAAAEAAKHACNETYRIKYKEVFDKMIAQKLPE